MITIKPIKILRASITHRQSRITAGSQRVLPELGDADFHGTLRLGRTSTAVFVTSIVPRQVDVIRIVNFDKDIAGLRCDLEEAFFQVSFVVLLIKAEIVPPSWHGLRARVES